MSDDIDMREHLEVLGFHEVKVGRAEMHRRAQKAEGELARKTAEAFYWREAWVRLLRARHKRNVDAIKRDHWVIRKPKWLRR